MAKGVAIVVLTVVVLAVIGVTVVAAGRAAKRSQRRWAVRHAQWQAYTRVRGEGLIEVGVQLVADTVGGPEVLRSERVTSVTVADQGSPDLLEAQSTAELRASTYNSVGRGS